MESSNVVEQLLILFDKLSDGFHKLNNTCENLKNTVNSNESCSLETKKAVSDLTLDVKIIKQLCNQIDNSIRELTSYKDNVKTIPKETFELIHTVRSEILEKFKTIEDTCQNLNEEFFKKVSNSITKNELQPVIKLSKLLVKPVGIIAFFILFTLGMMGTSLGIYKIFQLMAPRVQPIIQKIVAPTNQVKRISEQVTTHSEIP